jgi:hypothetical protein
LLNQKQRIAAVSETFKRLRFYYHLFITPSVAVDLGNGHETQSQTTTEGIKRHFSANFSPPLEVKETAINRDEI